MYESLESVSQKILQLRFIVSNEQFGIHVINLSRKFYFVKPTPLT